MKKAFGEQNRRMLGIGPKQTESLWQKALQRLGNDETQADIARTYAVDPTTIGRLEAAIRGGDA
jgi:hypothetical protein